MNNWAAHRMVIHLFACVLGYGALIVGAVFGGAFLLDTIFQTLPPWAPNVGAGLCLFAILYGLSYLAFKEHLEAQEELEKLSDN